MTLRVSFRTKLIFAFAGIGIATAAVLLHLSWQRGREVQLRGLQGLLKTTVASVAPGIDGDAHRELASMPPAKQLKDPRLAALRALAARVKSSNPRFKEVYTLATAGEPMPATGHGRWVAVEKDEDVGEDYDWRRFPAMAVALREPAADDDLMEDDSDGSVTISGYAPIRDRAGMPVGFIGIDVDAATVYAMRRDLLKLLAAATGAGLLLAGGLAWFFSARISPPVAALSVAMERVAAGDYGTRVAWNSGDEFDLLFTRFNAMSEGLEERQRLKHALALAMEIQQHLLPAGPPTVPGLELAGVADYCDETGGDYYDYPRSWALPGGRVALTVGDVTGHGIVAALLMASARAVLRSHAEREETPAEILALVNRHLVRDSTAGKFMTLFYGVLDVLAGTLVYANAGQGGCQILRKATGAFEELPASGPPLGVVEGCEFPARTVTGLLPGDLIALATDGVWEAVDPAGIPYEMDRLATYLRMHAADPIDDVAAGLLADVHAFRRGAPQADDITFLAARLSPR